MLLAPDLGQFLGHPYDPPQYEASSLTFVNATRPTSLCRPIKSSDTTTAAGEASQPQRLNFCAPCLRWQRHWARIRIFYHFYLSLQLMRTPASGVLTKNQRGRECSKAC